ncbi:GNAT family N-acetyltransferase [Brachybacterium halotolerans subsp. kimchii]|uniref:GNAT family N-acetyltransferase n=1 Tax=Brachybacterium halotolerans TaxID=2795215 RepID=UPI001E637E53|nr:GNAT family protein [Brachybacterium halotolerans]UEJ82017.1 GNAT family N-acetyltransferase [Brachybacterium halotolerans subsp. kimchii]
MARVEDVDRRGRSVRLERLGSSHAGAILAGQDRALAREVFGRRWEPAELAEFLERAERWSMDGPVREFAACQVGGGNADIDACTGMNAGTGAGTGADAGTDARACSARGEIVGGGGLHLLGPGLERGQADMSYWVLAPQRRHGWGAAIARALRDTARSDPRICTLVLRIPPENVASQHVARGAGARPTGRSERHPGDASRRVERWELDLDDEPDFDLDVDLDLDLDPDRGLDLDDREAGTARLRWHDDPSDRP